MQKRTALRLTWLTSLALTFLLLSVWYGGRGTPLTASEGQALLARIDARHAASPTRKSHPEFRRNLEGLIARDDGREFYMVNLERVRPGTAAAQADAAYSRIVVPLLLKRGSLPMLVVRRDGAVLGPDDPPDRVAIVRYRSVRDFLEMNAEPAMTEGAVHKFRALADTQVFATKPIVSSLHVRVTAALVLSLLAVAGWTAIGRLTAARTRPKSELR